MKKLLWILVIVVAVFGVWLFIKAPAQAPEIEIMEQEIAEHAPEGTTGADDEQRQSTFDDMTPPAY